MKEIIVIGGGPAGLMASITAAEGGGRVMILEKNSEAGRKILSTGNGRCNFTNRHMDACCYNTDDRKRMMAVIDAFGNEALIDFFRDLGVMTTDRDGWCYPASLSAESIQLALISRAERLGVKIKGGKTVRGIRKKTNRFLVDTDGYSYESDAVILSTGGLASPGSGSSGDGFSFLSELGVGLIDPSPALVPLVTEDSFLKKASGVRVDAGLTLLIEGKEAGSSYGNLQITDFGISGIPVFQLSSKAVRALDQGKDVEIAVDLLPEIEESAIYEYMQMAAESLKETDMTWLLVSGFFPRKLAKALMGKSMTIGEWDGRPPRTRGIVLRIKGSKGFGSAQTTSGGVPFSELSCDLSIKGIPGLFVCGEIVDVDGICGGYNLQWAFSSGYAAGKGVL